MTTTIIGLSGSLRKGSFNTALLRAAADRAPSGMRIELETLHGIPLYNGDDEKENGIPERVAALKDAIARADALLIASPEYNNSMPGVLKNAIDWCSRPPKDIAKIFGNKPVALAGATPGRGGTRLAQTAWLPVFRMLGTRFWTGGSLYVASAGEVFDADGALTDPNVGELLDQFIADFARFAST